MAVAGFYCRTIWPDGFLTALTTPYKKSFVSISQEAISFFLLRLMRKSYKKSAKNTFLSQRKDVQTGLFVLCSCNFFATFVIMTLVFYLPLLFVVPSCACDYLYYKRDLRCYERDQLCYERDQLCYERNRK